MTDTTKAPDTPKHRYDARFAAEIESRWQTRWEELETFRVPNPGDPGFDASRPKFYCLDMFPYPSGAGLHVGHPEGYTASDILCRYKRMKGFNVLHPMGWDAFGLPAEQYAVQTNVHPARTTRGSIEIFRRQLKRFGFCYDWSRELATIDPGYYRWTQWIWLQAYDAWYDEREGEFGVARRIPELERELEAGTLRVGASGRPVTTGGRGWTELTETEQRTFIDEQRLAYIGEQTVNWCPKLGTVLANEEVIDGRSERGGHPVNRKLLRQWMFRITAYAERLLANLDRMDWPESTRTMQKEWIGRSEGAEIDFEVPERDVTLRVYSTRPDTIFGATFMTVAPEHPLVEAVLSEPASRTDVAAVRRYVDEAGSRSDVDRMAEAKVKTGVDLGVDAVNPATGERIPVWVSDYVLMGYGHGAIMGVPGHDQRDFDFAKAFGLDIIEVVRDPKSTSDGPLEEATPGDGVGVNSANDEVSLDGLPTAKAKRTIIDWLERKGIGAGAVKYRLRDWLFSRQRYWGEPFPVVYDEAGNHYPVSMSALPVELPPLDDFQPPESEEPTPLLAKAEDWVHTTAGEAGVDPDLLSPETPVRRETNTMPNWAGSCWYYLRYCDPTNEDRLVSAEAERYWMLSARSGKQGGETWSSDQHHIGGVDMYIGGAEHAVLHLLYARFWHMILFDLGEVSTPEPFGRLFHQGMITSFAYQRDDKSLVPIDEVKEVGEGQYIEEATGGALKQVTAKMSKSLKNVINPDDVIAEYGADTFRIYEMYMGPLEASKPWNTRDIVGLFRFLQRAWRLLVDEETGEMHFVSDADPEVERQLHRTIAKVGEDIEKLSFNTAIAAMIEFVNLATSEKHGGGLTSDQAKRFAQTLCPFAPHMGEELWSRLGEEGCISDATWPEVDEAMLVDDEVEIPVQVMGKVRARITVPAAADAKALEELALNHERVKSFIEGKTVRKVIVVPGRMINIVAN